MYISFFKRFLDLFLSIISLLLFSPLFSIITVILIFQNRGKVFFLQDRPGKHGNVFKVIKFKTMNDLKDNDGQYLPEHIRLTKMGRIIRKTSIDELPQLFNVIKGDMSLVGPRPLLLEYLPIYNQSQFRRHEVRPGITGWAQVNGRNAISWEEKFNFDIWYVDNISFFLDLRILWITFLKVLKKEGINQKTDIPMEKFKGSA